MFGDVNRTIEEVLKAELPRDVVSQANITFATPDDTFPPTGVSLPAINLFLFEVHENVQLRDLEHGIEQRPDGTLARVAPPVRVDCHYLVTAFAQPQASLHEEHQLLGAALKALMRHRVLPREVLQGSLATMEAPVRATTALHDARPSIELWQALKGKPRACLHYTITVPVDLKPPEQAAPPVLELQLGGG